MPILQALGFVVRCFPGMVHSLKAPVEKTRAERAVIRQLVKSLHFTVVF